MKLTALFSGPRAQSTLPALISAPTTGDTTPQEVICITSTAQEMGYAGLRIAPDLDAAVNALTGYGATSTYSVQEHLARRGVLPAGTWPQLTDAAVAAALARNITATAGLTPAESAAAQLETSRADSAAPAGGPVAVLPVTDVPVELHVIESDGATQRGRHVLRWLADSERGAPEGFAIAGLDAAAAGPSVLDAIRTADVVVLLPMSPVLDAAGLLGVAGVRDALRGTTAPVVVISPVGIDAPRDATAETAALRQAGLDATSAQLATLYGDFVDRLVIDTDEPPASYPAALSVVRAPIARAVSGNPVAAQQLQAAVFSAVN